MRALCAEILWHSPPRGCQQLSSLVARFGVSLKGLFLGQKEAERDGLSWFEPFGP